MKTIIKQYTSSDQCQNRGKIAGYASIFDVVDHQRDWIAKGAFTKTLRAWKLSGKTPKMLWQHNPKQPIGVWTYLQEDKSGLYVEGRLIQGVPQADEAYLLMKEGALDGLSIGFRTLKAIQDKERKARVLLDIDLVEISLVTFSANARASVAVIRDG